MMGLTQQQNYTHIGRADYFDNILASHLRQIIKEFVYLWTCIYKRYAHLRRG